VTSSVFEPAVKYEATITWAAMISCNIEAGAEDSN
jgi:hypothetical protein